MSNFPFTWDKEITRKCYYSLALVTKCVDGVRCEVAGSSEVEDCGLFSYTHT